MLIALIVMMMNGACAMCPSTVQSCITECAGHKTTPGLCAQECVQDTPCSDCLSCKGDTIIDDGSMAGICVFQCDPLCPVDLCDQYANCVKGLPSTDGSCDAGTRSRDCLLGISSSWRALLTKDASVGGCDAVGGCSNWYEKNPTITLEDLCVSNNLRH